MSVTRIAQGEACQPSFSPQRVPRARREGYVISGITEKAGVEIKYTERRPPVVISESPIAVVSGYYGFKSTYGNFRDALATKTRRTVTTFSHDRVEKNPLHGLQPNKLLHSERIGAQSTVAIIDELYDQYGEKVDVVGHSKGGPDAVDGVSKRLGKVGHVVLMGSGGLERGQNSLRLMARASGMLSEEILPHLEELIDGDGAKLGFQAAYHTLRNPWRTIGEAVAISNRPLMTRELTNLHRAGIGLSALLFENDHFFPPAIARQDASDLVDNMVDMPGGIHLSPQTDPERTADYVTAVLQQTHELAA